MDQKPERGSTTIAIVIMAVLVPVGVLAYQNGLSGPTKRTTRSSNNSTMTPDAPTERALRAH